MNKRLQQVKRRNPEKAKDEFILLPAGNGNGRHPVSEGDHVKLASSHTPWYPIFKAKKYDPL
jgi:hypothetical protein